MLLAQNDGMKLLCYKTSSLDINISCRDRMLHATQCTRLSVSGEVRRSTSEEQPWPQLPAGGLTGNTLSDHCPLYCLLLMGITIIVSDQKHLLDPALAAMSSPDSTLELGFGSESRCGQGDKWDLLNMLGTAREEPINHLS